MLGSGRRIVEPEQYLACLDQIAFLHQHFANDSPLEMLHLFVLAGGDKRARGDDGTVQWSDYRPKSEAEQPSEKDGTAEQNWQPPAPRDLSVPTF
jgi:hypothetical protein